MEAKCCGGRWNLVTTINEAECDSHGVVGDVALRRRKTRHPSTARIVSVVGVHGAVSVIFLLSKALEMRSGLGSLGAPHVGHNLRYVWSALNFSSPSKGRIKTYKCIQQ